RAQSRSDNWLKDEGRCGLGIAGSKERFQIISASKPAVRIFRAERTVIAKGRRYVAPLRQERLIGSAARNVSADGHRSKRAPVIALAPRHDAIALRLTGFEMKLACQLDCGLGGFGAAGREVDASFTEIGRCEGDQASREPFRRGRPKLRRVSERDLRRL